MQPRQAPNAHPSRTGPGIKLLLWGLQSPINLGMLLRVAETYRVPVGVIGVEGPPSSTTSDFACGALQRVGFEALTSPAAGLEWRGNGRLVATSIGRDAEPLSSFQFEAGDVIALGNEYDGLPPEIEAAADRRIIIPMAEVRTPKPRSFVPIDSSRTAPVHRDGEPNLNVAVAGAIICYAAYVQALHAYSAGESVLV